MICHDVCEGMERILGRLKDRMCCRESSIDLLRLGVCILLNNFSILKSVLGLLKVASALVLLALPLIVLTKVIPQFMELLLYFHNKYSTVLLKCQNVWKELRSLT